MIREAIHEVVERRDISEETARRVMMEMIRGEATQSQIASFITAMRMKGETEQELRGFVVAMRELATMMTAPEGAVDLCGTGGDCSNSFNISTAAAFVVAGARIPVAKHGNRSVSSRCGSADVLAALGLPFDMGREDVEACMLTSGMGFLFAPRFHSSMKNVSGPRREIGVRTFFNVLGPMTNPAMVKHQLIGVCDPSLSRKMANVLSSLGTSRAMIVHGDGMDEITNLGETQVLDMRDGVISEYSLAPGDFGFDLAEPEDLRGGDPMQNARILLSILKGEDSPRTDVVVMNSAAAIYVSGKTESIDDGIEIARRSIEDGKAILKLREYSAAAREVEETRQARLSVNDLLQRRVLPSILIERSREIVSHRVELLSGSECGRASLGALDPSLLASPNVLSVIVLDRIVSMASNGHQAPAASSRSRMPLSSAISSSDGLAVIAEYKPRSPSSPPLYISPDPERVASVYSSSGIAGASVLVEPNHFGGSPELFSFFREKLRKPLLFKDFVVAQSQISFAASLGADAVLLIAKALTLEALDGLVKSSIATGLEPLIEVHDETDVAKIKSLDSLDSVKMIGVNCRDLGTMKTDLEVLAGLAPSLPDDKLIVSESGVQTPHDLEMIRSADAVLIGSMLMNTEDLERRLQMILESARGAAR